MLDDDDRVALVDQPLQHPEQLVDVLEVQARRRLVQDVYRSAGGTLLKLGGELDTLGLTTGEGGCGLAEPDVAEADVHQCAQVARDGRHRREEPGCLLDRHIQHVADGLALEMNFQRLTVVTRAMADLARHIDVGQEVHLDLDRAVTGAVVAATALDVEREPPGKVAADLGLGRLGEQLAHVVEDAGVCRGVAARGPSDRPLVDVHDLVEVLQPPDRLVPPGHLTRTVELVGENHIEDVVDQRRLARSRNPGDRNEIAQREADVDVMQVVLTCPNHGDLAPVLRASTGGDGNLAATGEIGAGDGLSVGQQVRDRAGVDDIAAVLPRTRTDVDDPVGGRNGVLVVLDDDDRVAQVAQSGQGLDQPVVVALVEADRRLVQDVENSDQPGADLCCQPDTLRLTTRQGAGRTVKRKIVQTHIEQKAQASLDLLDDPLGDLTLTGGEVDLGQELGAVGDREAADRGDAAAADLDGQ